MRMSDSSRLTRALIGTGTFLAGGNVTITDLTATNAIENNSFMPSPYPEVQEQQYKNMKATGEYLTNLLGEDAPGFADARAWFSSGCDVLNDMYFGLLPGISPENRAFMENQLPWNMAIDLIPAKVGEVGLVAAPLLRTGGQGAKAVFKALPSKGLTPNLATESGHALKVYGTKETSSGLKVTKHGVSRKIERQIRSVDELDAIKNPLMVKDIKVDGKGRSSQKYIGRKATVSLNPNTRALIQVNPTGTSLAKRLKKKYGVE